ncbi:glycosyltransferase [Quadrisphaera oryzae]|uniref:glycosyltransferase n=1 Tax=Quadrisphaera TaxID=317661 RepID=UPI001C93BEE5
MPPQTSQPDPLTTLEGVELVVVAYRSRAQVEQMLAGLPADLPLVVVDNSDGSDGLRGVVEARQHGRYLAGGGVGFARAATRGALSSTAEVVLFVNPDVRPTPAHLAAVVADVRADPALAASAACIVDADGPEAGRPQIGCGGWEPTVRRVAAHAAGLHKRLPTAGVYAKPLANQPLRVDWVSGGCMAVRREVFERLGGFDTDFYVYNEDMAFGRAARAAGLHEVLRTDVLVPGSSGGSGAPSLEMMRLRGASMARYVRKHHALAPALAMRALTAAGYAVRAAEQVAKGDRRRAREHWAYAVGAATATATVGGRVVTRG